MAKCPMVSHEARKIEVPCANHSPEKCSGVVIECKTDVVCKVCGFCRAHCVGHHAIRRHLAIVNGCAT